MTSPESRSVTTFAINPRVLEALEGVTICVTGATGYVGSHLVRALVDAGRRPFIIGRPCCDYPVLEGVDIAQQWHDSAALGSQLRELDNPVIINLAGHFVSRHTAKDIPTLVSGNLTFPIQIFDAYAASGHSRIVNVGTSWEYGDDGTPAPANLYANLKAANARALGWYAHLHGFHAINLKLNDTFGGRDHRAKLMPLLKHHAIEGTECILREAAQPINLLYIADVIDGLLTAAARTAILNSNTVEEAFLLGPHTCSLQGLVDMIISGPAPELKVAFESRAPSSARLRGVWEQAPRLPQWSATTHLEAGLAAYFAQGAGNEH